MTSTERGITMPSFNIQNSNGIAAADSMTARKMRRKSVVLAYRQMPRYKLNLQKIMTCNGTTQTRVFHISAT